MIAQQSFTDSQQVRSYLMTQLAGLSLDRQCMLASRLTLAALHRAGVPDGILCMGNVRVGEEWMYQVPTDHVDHVCRGLFPPVKIHVWVEAGGLTIDTTILSTMATQSELPAWKSANGLIFIDRIGSVEYMEHCVRARHPNFAHVPMI